MFVGMGRKLGAGFALLLLAGLGCEKQAEVRQIEQRPAPAEQTAGLKGSSTSERFGFDGQTPAMGGGGAGGSDYSWTAPEAWQEQPSSSLRLANFLAGPSQDVECYLSVLPGGAGGVLANVNRWRKQMGLGEITQAELDALPTLEVHGQQAALVELEGDFTGMQNEVQQAGAKMLGILFEHGESTVFVKMVGPAASVEAERENFLAFCRSIEHAHGGGGASMASELPAGHPPIDGAAGAQQELPSGHPEITGIGDLTTPPDAVAESLRWDAPEGWKRAPDRSVRLVTYKSGLEDAVETYVTVLPGAAGGAEPNILMWLRQMGHEESELDAMVREKRPIAGASGDYVSIPGSYTDMSGATISEALLLGAIVSLEGSTVFVKMTGPREAVQSEEAKFEAFVDSLRLEATASPASETAPDASEAPEVRAEPPASPETAPAPAEDEEIPTH